MPPCACNSGAASSISANRPLSESALTPAERIGVSFSDAGAFANATRHLRVTFGAPLTWHGIVF
jgi:hypothetical protein